MLQSYEEAKEHLKEGDPVLGWGWREVQAFEDMDDLEDYESEEEVHSTHPSFTSPRASQ